MASGYSDTGSATDIIRSVRVRLHLGTAAMAMTLLGACGGSGSSDGAPVSTPVPPTAGPATQPTPTPSETPTSSDTTNFETAEFHRSDGPGFHNAVSAWEAGATGEGVTIGVIDSGIDTDSPEFAGRIDSRSRDLASNRGLEDEGGHGTAVATVAAAGRNNQGVMGMAFDANLLVLRADTPGSCTSNSGGDSSSNPCRYSNAAIASGLDHAVDSGARIVNISLGGNSPNTALRDAVARATAEGVVVIVSAGNDGDVAGVDASNPNAFAAGLSNAGNGLVIIAGSVDDAGEISDFSNRAGSFGDAFLTARGERICCVYEDGAIANDDGFVSVYSGTSFAAPQIAGAAALLAQAFPNLSGGEIVELLLSTADDAGTAGTDAVYGRGVLNLEEAFQPQGQTSLAGTNTAISPFTSTGMTSAAMGDAAQTGQGLGAVILDGFDRAFAIDLARSVGTAQVERKLTPALVAVGRNRVASGGATQIALTISERPDSPTLVERLRLSGRDADRAQILAGSIITKVAPNTGFAIGLNNSAQGLAAQLQGAAGPAFLVADNGSTRFGQLRVVDGSVAVRQSFGDFSLTASAESGEALVAGNDLFGRLFFGNNALGNGEFGQERLNNGYRSASLAIDRRWALPDGGIDTALSFSWVDEAETILGARFDPRFGASGATSIFVDARFGVDLPDRWRFGAEWRQGVTRARSGGMIAGDGQMLSTAFAFDVSRRSMFRAHDRLALRFSQPLRVSQGGVDFLLPIGYDYATQTAEFGTSRFNLAPRGRELVGEIAYSMPLWGGALSGNAFIRQEPGHFETADDDIGLALRYGLRF
ncbi:MAG: S8 family peptidase [Pseudomonadota bacterium]